MKKAFIAIALLFISTNILKAQKRDIVEYQQNWDKQNIFWGYYLGFNKKDYKISYKTQNAFINVTPLTGFNVGLIADFRLHKNLSLRLEPGLVSNSKNIYFNHLVTKQDSLREIGSTYLHVPVIFKFSTDRYKNIRPYLLGGVSYNYNFSSNEANQDDNSSGQFRMKTHNFMYEVGMGIDIYLYYFKFSPSIRGIFAFNNEIKYDDDPNSQWTAPINFMGTRGVFLTFAFE